MTEGPTSRAEALALVAAIHVRALRRRAAIEAARANAEAPTRKGRTLRSGPTTMNDNRPLAKDDRHQDTPTVREGGGRRGS